MVPLWRLRPNTGDVEGRHEFQPASLCFPPMSQAELGSRDVRFRVRINERDGRNPTFVPGRSALLAPGLIRSEQVKAHRPRFFVIRSDNLDYGKPTVSSWDF